MVERSARAREQRLTRTFAAVSDPTRRAILARLRRGGATISELAVPFDVSFAAVSKHVQVLERAGLLAREVVGREHHLTLVAAPLHEASDWTGDYRAFWEVRLDALEAMLRASTPKPRRPARRPRRR
jgi:DNA-binding transcriptional ArsR family regulator